MNGNYKFFAFISYKHADIKEAKRLQSLLESYNLPSGLRKKIRGEVPKRFKVFRDTDELTSGILKDELKKKLEESKYLIVICSPNSVTSDYVADEISYFRSLGREHRIIPFIIDGAPHSDRECYNPALTEGGLELLGIDIQKEQGGSYSRRFHKAFIRLVAKLLELDFDVLWDRRKRQVIRRYITIAALTLVVVGSISYFASRANKERPFDSRITYIDKYASQLPFSNDNRDSISVYLSQDDVRSYPIYSDKNHLELKNIPGKYKDKPIRITATAFGCVPLDTIVDFSQEMIIKLQRDPEIFGRIRYYVIDSDGITPVTGALFDFDCIKTYTDTSGLLDVLIPIDYQRDSKYPVKISYNGESRTIAFQPEIDPILDREDIPSICLE